MTDTPSKNSGIKEYLHKSGIQKNKEDHSSYTWMGKGEGWVGHSGLATSGFSDNSETCSNILFLVKSSPGQVKIVLKNMSLEGNSFSNILLPLCIPVFPFAENQKPYKPYRVEEQSFDTGEARRWMNLHSK